jgi:hypothetical protein
MADEPAGERDHGDSPASRLLHEVRENLFWPLIIVALVSAYFAGVGSLPRWTHQHAGVLNAMALGFGGALVGEVASVRASLLKSGHRWPWEARTGTKPLGLGKYLVVVATDLLFGLLAGVVVYGEHVGLNSSTWKGALTLFFAGMSGPEILRRLGGAIRS